jgi:tRNA dimethylallyltransferase
MTLSDHPSARIIVILGPTAGGKSELAVGLAEHLLGGGQIVGADSMQVYRHLDAGTAKPTVAQRRRAMHHLIDIIDPTESFTVANWLELATRTIADIHAAGQTPIIVGGTNLYLKVLLQGMFDGPLPDPVYRASLAEIDTGELYSRLNLIDPQATGRISANDRKRIVRALEVYEKTGKPISQWQQQWHEDESRPYRFNPTLIGMDWPIEKINERINLRVKAMFFPDKVAAELAREICINGQSLPEETQHLEAAGLMGLQAREALGYKQVLEHLQGEGTMEQAFERTKILTRRFAKQQRTWLRRFRDVRWIEAGELDADELLARALELVG